MPKTIRIPKRITSRWLVKHEACNDAQKLFIQMWPKGVVLSASVIKRFDRQFGDMLPHTPTDTINWLISAFGMPHDQFCIRCDYGSVRQFYAELRRRGVPEK